jgi:hypothetical protein
LAGKNIKESAKERLKEAGKSAFSTGIKRGTTFLQTGKGKKRAKRRKLDVEFPNW